ncbi:hypothetical protein APHAL10511_005324 [Amanita phalloides]|nr:hypothetical protein APHAL10511_005324 [Amanita phalloides]
MPSIGATLSVNSRYKPSYLPVAIITGGTSGIGEHMAQAIARHTGGNAHIIIIGRNEAAANEVLASLPKPSGSSAHPGWKHEFIRCDVELMKNVKATCKALCSRLSRVNFLVLSAGYINFKGREDTEEGLDKKMAVRYYARWAFTKGLLPLLRNAKDAGEKASVMTILGAGWSPPIDMDDLAMDKYSGFKASVHTLTYNDLMVMEFARREPDIAFTHIYPGVVRTNAFHWSLRLLMVALTPLTWLLIQTPENCAEYMFYGLLEGRKGPNFRNEKADDIGFVNYHGSEASQLKLWEHTMKATGWEEP